MTINSHTIAALRTDLARLSRIVDDTQQELKINDPDISDRVTPVLLAARQVVEATAHDLPPNVADLLANLRSSLFDAVADFDPGADESGFSLRKVQERLGLLVMPVEKALNSARAMGLFPSKVDNLGPQETSLPRSSFDERNLHAMQKRLDRISDLLTQLRDEAKAADASPQQRGLLRYFINQMSAHVGLAKVELTVKSLINIDAVARAIENLAHLSKDLVAGARGMATKISSSTREAAEKISENVRKASGILRVSLRKIIRSVDAAVSEHANKSRRSSPKSAHRASNDEGGGGEKAQAGQRGPALVVSPTELNHPEVAEQIGKLFSQVTMIDSLQPFTGDTVELERRIVGSDHVLIVVEEAAIMEGDGLHVRIAPNIWLDLDAAFRDHPEKVHLLQSQESIPITGHKYNAMVFTDGKSYIEKIKLCVRANQA